MSVKPQNQRELRFEGTLNIAWSNALFGLGFVPFSLGEGVLIGGFLLFSHFCLFGFLIFLSY